MAPLGSKAPHGVSSRPRWQGGGVHRYTVSSVMNPHAGRFGMSVTRRSEDVYEHGHGHGGKAGGNSVAQGPHQGGEGWPVLTCLF